MKSFSNTVRLAFATACVLLVGGVAIGTASAAGTVGTPIITSIQSAPFEDQSTLGVGDVVIGGETITPDALACSTSTAFGYKTEKCIDPSSTVVYIEGDEISGGSFPGHLQLTFNGSGFFNTSKATYGDNGYSVDGTFPSGTYCVILWRNNGAGGYANQGNVCEAL